MTMSPASRSLKGHVYMISDRALTSNDYFLRIYPSTTLLADETGTICCPSYIATNPSLDSSTPEFRLLG